MGLDSQREREGQREKTVIASRDLLADLLLAAVNCEGTEDWSNN